MNLFFASYASIKNHSLAGKYRHDKNLWLYVSNKNIAFAPVADAGLRDSAAATEAPRRAHSFFTKQPLDKPVRVSGDCLEFSLFLNLAA
jgi:hypothetical protein